VERENLFELGDVVITLNAKSNLNEEDVLEAIARHRKGDWGELEQGDKDDNDLAITDGERVLSSYRDREGNGFYIITECDRIYTTVMMKEDY